MGKKETYICEICGDEIEIKYRHHVLPKSKGGRHGETVVCCYTCNGQVHTLFTVTELADKTFEQLMKTPEMEKYVNWKKKHPGDYRHKSSQKVRDWKKYHR